MAEGDDRGVEAEPWKDVWEAKGLEFSGSVNLSQLVAADGYDTAFGTIHESVWSDFVSRRAEELGLERGTSVFEVGCGAGAFLYVLDTMGCVIGGSDWSAPLVDVARRAVPGGDFGTEEASHLSLRPTYDVVFACGVFTYFPSLDYANETLTRMARKARHAVAIYDLPDLATRTEALEFRRAAAGGDEAYAERYDGLEHRFYDRAWVAAALRDAGLVEVHIEDQDMSGYGNAPFRYNAWGFLPEAASN